MALILIVDDEGFVRAIVEEILTSKGHTVLQAISGKEAVKMCEGRAFDLVITDLSMPLYGWLRSHFYLASPSQ